MRPADRMGRLKPYVFARLDQLKEEALARGVDVIDFGKGDPDIPTPPHIIARLTQAASEPRYHRYPPYAGYPRLRQAAADYYRRRYGVELDPASEVLVVIGSKEGLVHLFWAYLNEGDPVLLPDPGYPLYEAQALLLGTRIVTMPLTRENGFLPVLAAVAPADAGQAPLMVLNYPNNPTGAVADLAFYERAVEFAREHQVVLCHDFAYAETAFDGYRPPSVLQVKGAKDVAVEFFSLSKPFNMTGWRIGFAVGSPEIIGQVAKLKSNIDSGQFGAVQEAAVEALENRPERVFEYNNAVYARRRDRLIQSLRGFGLDVPDLKATLYLWVPVPGGRTAGSFSVALLENEGVMVTPGTAYGAGGEGYVRLSLTVPDEEIEAAIPRFARYFEKARDRKPGTSR